jgi:hypothetical protein
MMPELDPEWEYWVPDEEVAEALGLYEPKGFEELMDHRLDKHSALGMRFGRGRPDKFIGKLAPEKFRFKEPAAWQRHIPCAWCGVVFLPRKRGQVCCGTPCRMDKLHSGNCTLAPIPCAREGCGFVFRPARARQAYCSPECAGRVGAQACRIVSPHPVEGGCLHCGAAVPESGSRNRNDEKVYCSVRCGKAYRNKRYRDRKRVG